MSWKTVNEVLSLASIDQDFCQELLVDPLNTIRHYGFQLTEHEQQVISQIKVNDLTQLSQIIMEQLAQEQT